MDAELLQLAREAVVALRAANQPHWAEIAQLGVSSAGLGAILWGLAQMQRAGRRRDKEIDVLAENMRESTRTVGQALERQSAAMTQAFTQQGQALERQGRALEELLRRPA